MRTFLIIGIDPESIDFTIGKTPSGMTAEKLAAEVEASRQDFANQGDRADLCKVRLAENAAALVSEQLARSKYDCILIGGGFRPDSSVPVLEHIINAVHQHARDAAISFLSLPRDALSGAARVLSRDFKDAGLLSASSPVTS